MPKQTTTGKPSAGPAWKRAAAGSYGSADGRFVIQSGGTGRWFVVDGQEHDELGLPRTLGPFATLDAAKDAADAQRGRAAEASPLARRLAEAATGPRREPPSTETARREPPRRNRGPKPSPQPEPEPRPTSVRPKPVRPKPARPRSWIDELSERDTDAAARARTMIAALIAEGAPPQDAEAAVRSELIDGRPAIAEQRLTRTVARVMREVSAPARVQRLARSLPSGEDPANAAAELASAIAGQLVDQLGEVLRASGGHHAVLPGWELVERPGGRDQAGDGERPREIRLRAPDGGRSASE